MNFFRETLLIVFCPFFFFSSNRNKMKGIGLWENSKPENVVCFVSSIR